MSTEAETLPIQARTSTGTNWTGAFLLYAKGATLQEVAVELKIPFAKLKNKARAEDWENMVRLNALLALKPPATDAGATTAIVLRDVEKRIELNREDALKVAQDLRAHIRRTLDAYSEGKQFLAPQDIAALAKAAKSIDECAMMALGDDPAPKVLPSAGAVDQPKVKDAPHTHFHLHPPAVAMGPRVVRGGLPVEEVGPPARGTTVDAIMTPSPRVELRPTGSDEDDDPAVPAHGGRSTVDFSKLAKEVSKIPLPLGKGLPDFAKVKP